MSCGTANTTMSKYRSEDHDIGAPVWLASNETLRTLRFIRQLYNEDMLLYSNWVEIGVCKHSG